jgi:hypothetical protein
LQIKTGDSILTQYRARLHSVPARTSLRLRSGVLSVNARALPDNGRHTLQSDRAQSATADFPSISAQQSREAISPGFW